MMFERRMKNTVVPQQLQQLRTAMRRVMKRWTVPTQELRFHPPNAGEEKESEGL
jgi:hypothetical protein